MSELLPLLTLCAHSLGGPPWLSHDLTSPVARWSNAEASTFDIAPHSCRSNPTVEPPSQDPCRWAPVKDTQQLLSRMPLVDETSLCREGDCQRSTECQTACSQSTLFVTFGRPATSRRLDRPSLTIPTFPTAKTARQPGTDASSQPLQSTSCHEHPPDPQLPVFRLAPLQSPRPRPLPLPARERSYRPRLSTKTLNSRRRHLQHWMATQLTLRQPAAVTTSSLTGAPLGGKLTEACLARHEPDAMPASAPCHNLQTDWRTARLEECQNPFSTRPVKVARSANPERLPPIGPAACVPNECSKRGLTDRHWYPNLAV